MRLSLGYPSATEEKRLLHTCGASTRLPLQQVAEAQTGELPPASVGDPHRRYAAGLHRGTRTATRAHPDLALGASPRASLSLFKTAQALAAVRGRDHVLPDDIKAMAPVTLAHRLIVKPEAELRGHTAKSIVTDIVERTPLKLAEE